MIKKILDRLLGKSSSARGGKTRFGQRQEVPASMHHIDPELVDEHAKSVVQTLQKAGYEAYVVGGAVRDLLLGLRPKDFDVATNATPEQVKRLFRRAFIIGRRFRIVHVVFGRGRENEVIEVSTFRAYLDSADAEQVSGNERTSKTELAALKHAVDASGRVLRDNVWGPQEEDAARRDFTINAMYYDPASQIVVDYHNGIRDAQKRVLRMIGDPATRYREDPVRVLRAIRFAAKLAERGFKFDAKTAAPLAASVKRLADIPQSRLFDEMLKLLQTGHAMASVVQLRTLGLARGIYPLLDLAVQRADDALVHAALQDTDRRVAEGKAVAPSFLLACVLWSDVRTGWTQQMNPRQDGQRRPPPIPALSTAIDEVFDARIGDVSGRGKLGADMREIWMMQPRFDKRSGKTPYGLAGQLRFRAGLDFLRLRAGVGEVNPELVQWWEDFSAAEGAGDHARSQDLLDQVRIEQQKSKDTNKTRTRARPQQQQQEMPPPRSSGADADADGDTAASIRNHDPAGETGTAAASASERTPRKRRRRKPRANTTSAGADAAGGGAEDGSS